MWAAWYIPQAFLRTCPVMVGWQVWGDIIRTGCRAGSSRRGAVLIFKAAVTGQMPAGLALAHLGQLQVYWRQSSKL